MSKIVAMQQNQQNKLTNWEKKIIQNYWNKMSARGLKWSAVVSCFTTGKLLQKRQLSFEFKTRIIHFLFDLYFLTCYKNVSLGWKAV